VGNGNGLSRGDRNRSARLARLRELVPHGNAIAGIDLADDKQAAVVTDHDSRVIGRRRVSARAWELGELLDWAVARACEAGFGSVTVACEPTGHRWRVLDQLAAGRGLALVCVQPLLGLPGPRRRGPDPGQVRSQGRGADRAAGQRAALLRAGAGRCGVGAAASPGGAAPPADHRGDGGGEPGPGSGRMRLARGAGRVGEPVPVGDLVRVAGRGAGRCGGDLSRVRRLGLARFTAAVRRELPWCGGRRPCLRIIRAVFARWPTLPGSPRTAPARWSARSWRWATGGIPARLAATEELVKSFV
jgi:transposase